MIRILSEILLTLSASPAISLVAKATVVLAFGLIAAWFARKSRAALRHALLSSTFSVLLALPIVSLLATPVPISVPVAKGDSNVWPLFDNTSVPSSDEPASVRFSATAAKSGLALPPLSAILLCGWFIGAALFMIPIVGGLLQIRSLRRFGLPWRHGQAAADGLTPDALTPGARRRVEVLLHESLSGPMTCGVLKPLIILPADAQSWDKQDLERALVHELEHVRRYDWPIHCLARVACAAYWFHPLVWIAWRQLALEAERSCDDTVLRSSEATAYADQLVGLARRRSVVGKSPVLAMANRSDLAARVGAVLNTRQKRGRAGATIVVLTCATAALVIITMSPLRMVAAQSHVAPAPMPIQVAQVQQPPVSDQPKSQPPTAPKQPPVSDQPKSQPVAAPKFDVASIKLNKDCGGGPGRSGGAQARSAGRLRMNCASVQGLIQGAYIVLDASGRRPARGISIEGGPAWTESDLYAIEAEADGAPGEDVMRGPMMQALLEDRFHLKIHRETREIPVYVLTVAKGGPKLRPFVEGSCTEHAPGAARPGPDEKPWCGTGGMRTVRNGRNVTWDEVGASFLNFASFFGIILDRPVIDKTGITGTFDFHLEFAPDETTAGIASPFAPDSSLSGAPSDPAGAPSIFTAFQQQLGLKLEAGKGPSEVLVIDHIERPSEN
jgi:uncharacterized protein (TIGR03435 family)